MAPDRPRRGNGYVRIRFVANRPHRMPAHLHALAVDITQNGGGSLWLDPVARMLTGVKLKAPQLALTRTPAWRARLEQAMTERLMDSDGQIALTFEVIYGHAFKAAPRAKVQASTSVSLQDMRAMLRER